MINTLVREPVQLEPRKREAIDEVRHEKWSQTHGEPGNETTRSAN